MFVQCRRYVCRKQTLTLCWSSGKERKSELNDIYSECEWTKCMKKNPCVVLTKDYYQDVIIWKGGSSQWSLMIITGECHWKDALLLSSWSCDHCKPLRCSPQSLDKWTHCIQFSPHEGHYSLDCYHVLSLEHESTCARYIQVRKCVDAMRMYDPWILSITPGCRETFTSPG